MKLAQALNLRKKLEEDFNRVLVLAKSQSVALAGDPKPDRSMDQLIQSMLDISQEQHELASRIERTNFAASVKVDGKTLTITEALCRRLVLKNTRDKMETLLNVGSRTRDTYSGGHYKTEPTILALDVSKLRRILDDLSAHWRNLDDIIQEANWVTELIYG